MYSNDYKHKTICFLGDSITDGIAVKKNERYFELLGAELGFNAVGYGMNGAKFAALSKQIEQMKSDYDKNVDAIFIFAGTNDFNGNIPIGDWYTTQKEIVVENYEDNHTIHKELTRRDFCYDSVTFRGSINKVIFELKQFYTCKQIVLMTPLHRAYAKFSLNNIQYPENYSNKLGLFMEDYVSDVCDAAKIWSCELIDLWQTSGLLPILDQNAKAYFADINSDGLHPNAAGHRRIADVIKVKLNNILI